VGDEQHPLGLRALRIERAKPGLTEAGGEDDEARGVAGGARRLEGGQRLLLNRMRLGGRAHRLREDTHHARRRWLPAPAVRVHPIRVDAVHLRMPPELLERVYDVLEAAAVVTRDGAAVPFDPGRLTESLRLELPTNAVPEPPVAVMM